MTAPDLSQALADLLEDLEDEKKMHAAMVDRLAGMARLAVRFFNRGQLPDCHETCRAAIDLATDGLGDAEPFELLFARLGYASAEPNGGAS